MTINDPIRPALQLAALCVLGIFAPTSQVYAAAPTSTIGVTATVQATCLISTSPLAFGVYTGTLLSVNTTINVTCTNTTPYNVGIDAGTGTGPAATVTTRHMNGTSTAGLAYTLKSGSQAGPNWGVTVGTDTVAAVATGAAQPMTVYGSVAAGLYIAPGTYTDTVIATVIY